MIFLHPVLLCLSFFTSCFYSIFLNGKRAVKFNVIYMIPVMVAAAVWNPLFNHAGVTIMLYFPDGNPLTLESVAYGAAAGCMLVTVIIWFSCYNAVMTSDKFIYLFGRILPALSLIFSMVLRFVPRFKAQIKVISDAQRGIGKDPADKRIWERMKNSAAIFSIFVTWALENAIETSDSMKSRGYGLKGRTAFSIYRFDKRDGVLLSVLFLCFLVLMAGNYLHLTKMRFFPFLVLEPFTPFALIVYGAYAVFLNIPLILNIMENVKWNYIA